MNHDIKVLRNQRCSVHNKFIALVIKKTYLLLMVCYLLQLMNFKESFQPDKLKVQLGKQVQVSVLVKIFTF